MANKDIESLRRRAEKQDWTVEATSGGHYKFIPPDDGDFIITSQTPSDSNVIKNIRRDLERAGLDLGRPGRKGTGGRVTPKKQAHRLRPSLQFALAAIPQPVLATGDSHLLNDEEALAVLIQSCDDEDLLAWISNVPTSEALQYARMIRDLQPDYPVECRSCDFVAADNTPLTLYKHMGSTGHKAKHEEAPMERDMIDPPQREKLGCPFCDEWFWVGERRLLNEHTDEAHAKSWCPSCKQYFDTPAILGHYETCPAALSPRKRRGQGRHLQVAQTDHLPIAAAEVPHTPSQGVQRVPAAASGHRGGDWNPDPCLGGCGQPVGDSRGTSSYCAGCGPIMDELQDELASAELAEAAATQMHPSAQVPASKPKRSEPNIPAVAAGPGSVQPPTQGGHPFTPPTRPDIKVTPEVTDDDLFILLEMVLDGPVTITRESFGAINDWMDATRCLIAIKNPTPEGGQ